MATYTHIYDFEIVPDYSARSLLVFYFDENIGRAVKTRISFLEAALTISPTGKGKIYSGYEFEAYEETMGGQYIEFQELTMEPTEFFWEVMESSGKYKMSRQLKRIFYQTIEEACRLIIAGRN